MQLDGIGFKSGDMDLYFEHDGIGVKNTFRPLAVEITEASHLGQINALFYRLYATNAQVYSF